MVVAYAFGVAGLPICGENNTDQFIPSRLELGVVIETIVDANRSVVFGYIL
ncbi:MAG: hypothetical protein HZA18_08375 [Nitrospirae bacterium]|nr:hypothetical protein [Nitrospirota bacterium]